MTIVKTHRGVNTSAIITCIVSLSGCGMMGDTGSVKSANELAIDCRTEEALAALEKAEQSGGLSKYLAGLERVGILRDAGRDDEAAKALADYKAQPEAATSDDAEIERSLDEFIAELRNQRQAKSGSATCP